VDKVKILVEAAFIQYYDMKHSLLLENFIKIGYLKFLRYFVTFMTGSCVRFHLLALGDYQLWLSQNGHLWKRSTYGSTFDWNWLKWLLLDY